jgi:hypothetical protein
LTNQCTDETDPEIGFDQDDPRYWRALHVNLHHAIMENDIAEVKRLLSLGADINVKTEHGYNALDWADHLKHLEVAKCLLHNMNIKLHGYVEILKHIRAKHPIIVRALLEMGVTGMLAKNKRFHRGMILQACRIGHPTILQMLINCLPGYMITEYKQVYLQVAASEHNDDVLEILRARARQEEAWRENYFRPKVSLPSKLDMG